MTMASDTASKNTRNICRSCATTLETKWTPTLIRLLWLAMKMEKNSLALSIILATISKKTLLLLASEGISAITYWQLNGIRIAHSNRRKGSFLSVLRCCLLEDAKRSTQSAWLLSTHVELLTRIPDTWLCTSHKKWGIVPIKGYGNDS